MSTSWGIEQVVSPATSRASTSKTKDNVLQGFTIALRLADSAAAAFPPLQAATGAAVQVLDIIKVRRKVSHYGYIVFIGHIFKTFKDNPKEWADLGRQINDFIKDIEPYAKSDNVDEKMLSNLQNYTKYATTPCLVQYFISLYFPVL